MAPDGLPGPFTNHIGPKTAPAVSPNGKFIAYTGFDDRYQGHQTTKLYLMDRDGTNTRCLSEKLDRDIQDPQWVPDNSGVYGRYDDQGDSNIAFFSVDATSKKIADHLASTTGAGGSGTFSLSHTGLLALTYGRTDNPGDIAISNNGAMKVLTALNQELLAQKKPGHVEEFTFESSKDNRKIHR